MTEEKATNEKFERKPDQNTRNLIYMLNAELKEEISGKIDTLIELQQKSYQNSVDAVSKSELIAADTISGNINTVERFLDVGGIDTIMDDIIFVLDDTIYNPTGFLVDQKPFEPQRRRSLENNIIQYPIP